MNPLPPLTPEELRELSMSLARERARQNEKNAKEQANTRHLNLVERALREREAQVREIALLNTALGFKKEEHQENVQNHSFKKQPKVQYTTAVNQLWNLFYSQLDKLGRC